MKNLSPLLRHLAGAAALLLAVGCGPAQPVDPDDAPPPAAEASPTSSEPPPAAEDSNNFQWNGGRVISNVEITAVYWGYSVNSTVANQIPEFYATVTDSSYMDWLSEYGTPNQPIGRGTFHGAIAISPGDTSTTLHDSDITTELTHQINAGHLPVPNANTLFMIHFPQNTTIISRNNKTSCVTWCAYHQSFTYNGQSVAYAILPDMAPGSNCNGGCGSASNFFDNQTGTATHEMAEAITDPDGGSGWVGNGGNEIGDVCNHAWTPLPGTGYTVQKEWSKLANNCVLVGPYSGVVYTNGDFDGDGKTDMIITTSAGSFWYFSNGDGTWANPYSRTDLPVGKVSYTVGDYDGDGKSDLIITTSAGSFWYFSQWHNSGGTRTGGWNTSVTRTDLPIGAVTYATGDFDGDGKIDMIQTTATGSIWLRSTSTGGVGSWTTLYNRPDLLLNAVAYTMADFDGDGKTDMIITNSTGSYWYFSHGDGTWATPYSRSDSVLGLVSYVPGDFSGSLIGGALHPRSDLIVTTTLGSFWYWSNFLNGAGSFSQTYVRTDLPLGHQRFTAANFAGATAATDMIITTSLGSFWYWSNGDGSWFQPYTRPDLPLGAVLYSIGDYNGDHDSDMVVLSYLGSAWDFANGTGTWTNPYTRPDLIL